MHLEKRVFNLSSLSTELNNVEYRSKEMSSKIHSASISGNEISKQVSELDRAQSRVESTLSRVTLMLDLKQTIKKVEECMNQNQFEIASNETYRILHSDENKIKDIKEIDEVSYEILKDLEERLIKLIKKQVENAEYENNLPEIIRFASLYPLLGNESKKEGLNIYCSTINKELRLNLEEQNLTLETQAKDSIINYVSIIETYIDTIFGTITQNENDLKSKFKGCYPIFKLVQILHNETDLSLSKLLNHYLETNEIDQLVKKIGDYNKTQHSNNMTNKPSETMEIEIFKQMKQVTPIPILDKILDEISHISQELMAYDTTIRVLLKEQKEEEEELNDDNENIYQLPKQSKIGSIRQRLTGDYILLEQFNMQYQMYRVLIEENNIDTHNNNNNDDNNYRSTLSGAIYYLLKTLAIRSFNTYDCNVSCAIVNNICNSLEVIYKEWLDKKLKLQPGQRDKSNIAQQFYRSTKNLYGGMTQNNGLNHKKTIILLNTVDQSINDNNLITSQLEQEVNQIFEDATDKDKFKIRQTLKGFEDISKSFERIIQRGIDRYSQLFRQILQNSLNRFKDENYQLTDKQFNNKSGSNNGTNNNNNNNNNISNNTKSATQSGDDRSFVQILIDSSRPTFYALSRRLTNANFDRILIYILSYYLNELERFILYHKFTFWGSLKFDKNRQELQSYFSELTSTRSIRDQFVRIRSIAEILQFSKIDEAINYVNDDLNIMTSSAHGGSTSDQSLTPDEIKKFLTLRSEFSQYEIQQLQI